MKPKECCLDREARYLRNMGRLDWMAFTLDLSGERKAREEYRKTHPFSPSLTRCDVCSHYIGQQGGKVVQTFPDYARASVWMDEQMDLHPDGV